MIVLPIRQMCSNKFKLPLMYSVKSLAVVATILAFYLLVAVYYFSRCLKNLGNDYVKPLELKRRFPSYKGIDNSNYVHIKRTEKSTEFTEDDWLADERRYWMQWNPLNFSSGKNISSSFGKRTKSLNKNINLTVDVLSNSELGDYVWNHLLTGHVHKSVWGWHGETIHSSICFRFRSGDFLDTSFIPDSSEHLLLVLDVHDNTSMEAAKSWIIDVHSFLQLRNVGLILHVNDSCNEPWLTQFIQSTNQLYNDSSIIRFMFINHFHQLVDNQRVFFFTNGVSRDFPRSLFLDIAVPGVREYTCSIIGNHSILDTVPAAVSDFCYVNRFINSESTQLYAEILRSSDLTLCLDGRKSHQIYDAVSVGTVPIIFSGVESLCVKEQYSLTQQYDLPAIFITNWTQLMHFFQKEKSLSLNQKENRRLLLLNWYKQFRQSMTNNLTKHIYSHFVL